MHQNVELMCVAVKAQRGDELVGTLTIKPLFADQTCGDKFVIEDEDIPVVWQGSVAR